MSTKEEFRSLIRKERNSLTRDIQTTLSSAIQAKFFQLEEYKNSSLVFIYVSVKKEVNTLNMIDRILADGKLLFVPRAEGKYMNFYQIEDLNSLVISKFGISEPDLSHQVPYTKEAFETVPGIRLMVLPGLAFDTSGNRIGYGAGYYDKYLNSHTEDGFVKIALSYGFQIFDELSNDNYDVKVDKIITPARIIDCSNN